MAAADNPSRERILARIQTALRERAPQPLAPVDGPPFREAKGGNVLGQIFPPIDDPFQRFATECDANQTELILTQDRNASALVMQEILGTLPEGEVFVQNAPCLREIMSHAVRPLRWSSEGPARESSQACVTLAEALIAQTGSIMVSSAAGGRGASIVPPCHIVFATRDQLVPDIETALAEAERRSLTRNSFLGLITGSSRTADIEKILVLGAHGPRRLVVIVEG